jgi:hypothetical protein
MKNIIIFIFIFFSLNNSFGQMEVYRGKKVQLSNGNLVGLIYNKEEVYKYSNGEENMFGIVRENKFYVTDEHNDELLSKTEPAGSTNKIYVIGNNGRMEMVGFEYFGSYYIGDDINHKSDNMIGWATSGGASSINTGRFAAAFMMIILSE